MAKSMPAKHEATLVTPTKALLRKSPQMDIVTLLVSTIKGRISVVSRSS